MLKIKRYTLGLKENGKQILDNASLEIENGQICVLVGKNGVGKSSFAMSLLGLSEFERSGSVMINNIETIGLDTYEIAKLGLFVSFQTPPEFEGITLGQLILSAYKNFSNDNLSSFKIKKEILKIMSLLDLDSEFLDRDVNVGFSGGERRKSEILQLLVLRPQVVVMDEVDSGLDISSLNKISKILKNYTKDRNASLLVISHNPEFIKKLQPNKIFELKEKQFCEIDMNDLLE